MNEVFIWLKILDRDKRDLVSLFYTEFNLLNKLCPVQVVRTINNNDGDARIYFINRLDTIQMLKDLYGFHTKQDAATQLTGE